MRLGLVTAQQRADLEALAHRVNGVLRPLFARVGLELVDFKL